MKGTINKLEMAQTLERVLWGTSIAYGDPPRLWRVAPNWYFLWQQQWQQVQEFGRLLPSLRRIFDGDESPTYLRADFTLNRRGDLVLLELNGTPVWDFGTQIVREIYHEHVGLTGEDFDPFPGAASAIGKLLRVDFPRRRVIIYLGPDRIEYQAEYQCLSDFFKGISGIEALVTGNLDVIRPGDLVYRTFGRSAIPVSLRRRQLANEIAFWPRPTVIEEKAWMAKVYLEPTLLESLSDEASKNLQRFLPRTWLVDPNLAFVLGEREHAWSGDLLMGSRLVNPLKPEKSPTRQWVLKPIRSGQGKGTVFSRLLSIEEWREALLKSLVSVNGHGPTHVLQEEVPALLHKVTYFRPGNHGDGALIEENDYRVRLCVAYLVSGDKVEIVDADATLRNHPLVHGASDAVILPVVVRKRR